jgi:S-adenosylmethionine:tRNA ribosyltransferase-isomerase
LETNCFGDDDSLVAEVIDNTTSRGRTLRFLYDGSYEELEKLTELEKPNPKIHKQRRYSRRCGALPNDLC